MFCISSVISLFTAKWINDDNKNPKWTSSKCAHSIIFARGSSYIRTK